MLPLLITLLLQASGEDGLLGTYRVQATVLVSGVPLVRSLDLRGDVVLRPGDRPRALRARLAAQGHACELAGTATEPGRILLAGGQRCPILVDDPGVRGTVQATLRSGEARVERGRLVLVLDVSLSGNLRLASGLLAGIAPDAIVPVDGSASVHGEGDRDNSRAAE